MAKRKLYTGWGGNRKGAGRPNYVKKWETSKSVPPVGAVEGRAIRGLKHRVPKDTDPKLAELADYAFSRIVDVMNEQVGFRNARGVLAAATITREEICGPLRKDINVHHTLSYEQLVNQSLGELPPPPAEATPVQAAQAVLEINSEEIIASLDDGVE